MENQVILLNIIQLVHLVKKVNDILIQMIKLICQNLLSVNKDKFSWEYYISGIWELIMNRKINILILNWNGSKYLIDLIQSKKAILIITKLLLIDNNSDDDSLDKINK